MDFKQIEAFISVAKYKSFSKAANVIFLSQPTISSHISSLEKELNIQLFDRSSKEVNLTPAGSSFLDYAVDIINTRNHAVLALSDFNSCVSGKLNLSASTTPCNSIVPSLLQNFSQRYPSVTFNINEQSSGRILKDIENLDCELGIIGSAINNERIKSYKLLEDELVIIANPKFNLPPLLDINKLYKYPFIFREKNSATRTTFENLLSSTIDLNKINVYCEVNNLDTLLQFVKTGMGISIVSSKVYDNYAYDKSIMCSKLKDISIKRNIFLIMNSKRTLSPTGRAFFNMCKELYNF
ncbi:DNA-binding transcriptional regulator, LysR family [Hathewaya proteolytica DSM 3090]|uniref:DNA-binding transcriptional regulator, LysR family n=1 Tax=Hathewaya proteolytica DSM 3090 TaxID=1121331 RepID=A0A1M6MSQ4_9CLOT|nr:selenium metabolism-associated LysR family transcriptional regulator [Hathewaya proteolytica]SHJ86555.1 DNA-binding transcriptional regulator, LysR family [Hathewaya proteolytica DSM 3090]